MMIFGASVIACACIGVLLRTISLFFFYDADIGYFTRGAVLPVIFHVFILVAAIACAVLCFFPKITLEPTNFGESKTAQMLYAFPALTTLYSLILQVNLIGEYSDLGQVIPRIELFILIFNALALVYFVLSIFGARINAGVSVVLGVFSMLWLTLMLVSLYFDMYIQINSPNKTIMAFALVSAVLFLAGEIRLPLKEKKAKIRLFSAAFAVLLLSTSSIPTLIAHFAGALGSGYTATIGDLICLTLLAPVCARFVKLCFAEAPSVSDNDATQPESDIE